MVSIEHLRYQKHYDANWRNNPELSVKDRAEAQKAELDTVAYLLSIKNSELRKLTEAQETKLAKDSRKL